MALYCEKRNIKAPIQPAMRRFILLPSRLYCRLRNLTGSTVLSASGKDRVTGLRLPILAAITAGREFHPAPKDFQLLNTIPFLNGNVYFCESRSRHFSPGNAAKVKASSRLGGRFRFQALGNQVVLDQVLARFPPHHQVGFAVHDEDDGRAAQAVVVAGH